MKLTFFCSYSTQFTQNKESQIHTTDTNFIFTGSLYSTRRRLDFVLKRLKHSQSQLSIH